MSSCLSVDIRKASNGIEGSVSLSGSCISPMVSEMGAHLKVSCGIVCSLSDVFYLIVSPDEPQWITSDANIIYDVTSNVIWTVE